MILSTRAQLIAVTSVEGVKLPAAVQKALAAAQTVEDYRIPAGVGDGPRAVAVAIAEGRDPFTDPAVVAAVTADRVREWKSRAADAGWAEAVAVVAAHSDEIVTSWRPVFDAAAKDLAEAVPSIGKWAHDSDEALDVLNRGGDAAQQWVKVKEALKVIDGVLLAWNTLAAVTRRLSNAPSQERNALIVANLTPGDYRNLFDEVSARARREQRKRRVTVWDVARAGHKLHLHTITEYLEQSRRRDENRTAEPVVTRPANPTAAAMRKDVERNMRPEALELAETSRKQKQQRQKVG